MLAISLVTIPASLADSLRLFSPGVFPFNATHVQETLGLSCEAILTLGKLLAHVIPFHTTEPFLVG